MKEMKDYDLLKTNREIYGFTVAVNIRESAISIKMENTENVTDSMKSQLQPIINGIILDAMKEMMDVVSFSDIEEEDIPQYSQAWTEAVLRNEKFLLESLLNDSRESFRSNLNALAEMTRLGYLVGSLKQGRDGIYESTKGFIIYEGIRVRKMDLGYQFTPDIGMDWSKVVKLSQSDRKDLSHDMLNTPLLMMYNNIDKGKKCFDINECRGIKGCE